MLPRTESWRIAVCVVIVVSLLSYCGCWVAVLASLLSCRGVVVPWCLRVPLCFLCAL